MWGPACALHRSICTCTVLSTTRYCSTKVSLKNIVSVIFTSCPNPYSIRPILRCYVLKRNGVGPLLTPITKVSEGLERLDPCTVPACIAYLSVGKPLM
jgi:hypothetical protein